MHFLTARALTFNKTRTPFIIVSIIVSNTCDNIICSSYAIWESYAGRYFDLDPRVANLYFESCRHTCLNIKETSFWDDK